jgi:hypothetical protein
VVAVESLARDDTFRLTKVGRVVLATWFDAPTLDQMLQIEAFGRQSGKDLAFCNVIVRGRPIFSEEVRRAAIRMVEESCYARGAAHLVLVEGLKGAAVRAFLGMVNLVGKSRTSVGVFGDTPTAARFLAGLADQQPSAGDIAVAIEETLVEG